MSAPHCPPNGKFGKATAEAIARDGISELDAVDRHWQLGIVGSGHLSHARDCIRELLARLRRAESERDTHKANAQTLALELRDVRAESRRLESLVTQRKAEVEEIADRLHQEQVAHEQTRQALVEATKKLEQLRPVEAAARDALRICDTPTTQQQQEARLAELDDALGALRNALEGASKPVSREEIASIIMLASMRAGGEGRDFNAYEAADMLCAWMFGTQPLALESDPGHQAWLQLWKDAGAAAREAETIRALDKAGVPAGVTAAPGVISHFPAARVRWLSDKPQEVLGRAETSAPTAPPEAPPVVEGGHVACHYREGCGSPETCLRVGLCWDAPEEEEQDDDSTPEVPRG